MLNLICLFVLLLLIVIILFSFRRGRALPLEPNSKVLLVIAHPDDETMFFSPVLKGLRAANHRLFILCISNGNFYGQGCLRSAELRSASEYLGIAAGDITVLDYDIFADGAVWDKNALCRVIMRHVEMLSIECILTFDVMGVSGHSNHSACFYALQDAYTRSAVPENTQIFVLDTVPLIRKYLGMADSPLTVLRSPFCYFARGSYVVSAWRAMCCHRSQLVWFRILYMIFSRYIYMGSLRRIAPLPRRPKGPRSISHEKIT